MRLKKTKAADPLTWHGNHRGFWTSAASYVALDVNGNPRVELLGQKRKQFCTAKYHVRLVGQHEPLRYSVTFPRAKKLAALYCAAP